MDVKIVKLRIVSKAMLFVDESSFATSSETLSPEKKRK